MLIDKCIYAYIYVCCEIIVKENREGRERENYIIDILRGVLHRAPKGWVLFIAKG